LYMGPRGVTFLAHSLKTPTYGRVHFSSSLSQSIARMGLPERKSPALLEWLPACSPGSHYPAYVFALFTKEP
jgi:hypothetical protein